MNVGLVPRVAIATVVVAVIVGAAFTLLLVAIDDLRAAGLRATHARQELAAADRLEKLIIDLETGVRGFAITGEERFLEPWNSARRRFPAQARILARSADNPQQADRVRRILRAGLSYIRDYSAPLVNAVRRAERSVRSVAVTAEGKRRVDAIRARFDRFSATERALLTERQRAADSDARRAITLASVGLGGSVFIVLLLGGYLATAIVRPVRRGADMAGRLAGGDLSVRMPEASVGEIGALERSFNSMARSLQSSRNELEASRARVLVAADEERRRVVRDLHDGAQQRLVHTIITMKLARRALRDGEGTAEQLMEEALGHAEQANSELRELVHGILPSVLTRGGLKAGVESLVSRVSLPVEVDVPPERLPQAIEATAYFVIAEALTNAVKHSRARTAHVNSSVVNGTLRVEVRDDGVGGARLEGASGLLGLADRVTALGGRFDVESPVGRGTVVTATMPLSG